MAVAQALRAAIAVAAGSVEAVLPAGAFAAMWLGSAGLFRVAAREGAAA